MTKPATVRRTRRVSNPFDARLEVRLYSTELAKLRDEAKKREMSASDLVRSQLGDLIRAEPPERTATPARGNGSAQALTSDSEMVDLAEAISDLTGISWGHAVIKIRTGKVTVAGEPWPHSQVPVDRLAQVAVSGELLPVE
jgi:hypothetical protein